MNLPAHIPLSPQAVNLLELTSNTLHIWSLKIARESNDITLSRVTFKSRIYINHSQLDCIGQFKINNLQEY